VSGVEASRELSFQTKAASSRVGVRFAHSSELANGKNKSKNSRKGNSKSNRRSFDYAVRKKRALLRSG
jgi:hypothetical protein